MTNFFRFILFLVFFIVLTSGCCYPLRHDGPYKGKVVDAETGQPIEGVVVLGVWFKVAATPAGGVSSYYDARETVTDRNGEFEIQGVGLKILSNVAPMNVLIFKSGYAYIGLGPWESLSLDGGLLMKKVAWEGDRAVIPLKKLTMEERKIRHADKELIPDNKQRLLIKELNKEYRELGIPLYPEEGF
ncbi:MAG: hypothetical protein M0Z67_00180 [Nitrospiraceae bacterium]|nr:hypothetical protein [Nitrospiraceae bacterium]